MTTTRLEKDSMGELAVPADAHYGAQTQRALLNFPVSGQRLPQAFIRALIMIKLAAARSNVSLAQLDDAQGAAIVAACRQLLADDDLMRHFPLDVYQTGSGTSSNMNANEVIAHLASAASGLAIGANDHVNCSQSSNDTIPSAIHIAAVLGLEHELLPALRHLQQVMQARVPELEQHVKTGRTHLMDALPVRLGQVVSGWAQQIAANVQRLEAMQPPLRQLAQGGTAVGTGLNAHPEFAGRVCQELRQLCNQDFVPAPDYFAAMGAQDTLVALSGQLRTAAVSLMKIANDLRWMNSGPLAGLGEITLEALQPGSSIMPGKVNPVIPEATCMVAAQVIGYDTAVAVAGQSGNFELNVMLPLLAHNLLDSIRLLANVSRLLADKAIASFTVCDARLQQTLARNPILVTALNPLLGYDKAAAIAKQAYREGRPILDVAVEQTGIAREQLAQLLDPLLLTRGGLHDH